MKKWFNEITLTVIFAVVLMIAFVAYALIKTYVI